MRYRHKQGHGDRLQLYGTVATTGAPVIMFELGGTRIIGPFYKVSLYVWSSLISVALITLLLSYYLGGVAADRETSFYLSGAIGLAGLTAAAIPFISRPILLTTNATRHARRDIFQHLYRAANFARNGWPAGSIFAISIDGP